MLYYHKIGTPQCAFSCFPGQCCSQQTLIAKIAEDILVMRDASHPDWMFYPGVSEIDGRYLELHISKDTSRGSLDICHTSFVC